MSLVELAVSPLGGVPGATAYHSSVLVDGEEFSFSNLGITSARGAASHAATGCAPRIQSLGSCVRQGRHIGRQLVAVLAPHFQQGTYDLLRKNCNTFTDCALFFLLRQRLAADYKVLERFGASMPALVGVVSGGCYSPNPRVAGFDLEGIIRSLDTDRDRRAAERLAHFRATESSNLGLLSSWLPWCLGSRFALAEPELRGSELSADAELARQLQAEEEENLADEQMARALQAEEEGSIRVPMYQQWPVRQRGNSAATPSLQAQVPLLQVRLRRPVGGVPASGQRRRRTQSSDGADVAAIEARTTRVTFGGTGRADGVAGWVRQALWPDEAVSSTAAGDDSEAGKNCAVCLEVFTTGDQLRILPCLHRFHKRCIDRWLSQSPLCPVCKHSILP
mmetsp:Transcript_93997/g.303593  ORF Transcript_93997/g.303593 Transcript_93997/m.303593 type:complete len:393 (-) Transcript_93997:192-1370(-)